MMTEQQETVEAIIERVADRIQNCMGPLFGSPEYLADPVKLARSQKRQRDSALAYAKIAVDEALKPEQLTSTLNVGGK